VKFSSDASVDDAAIGIHFEERLGSWLLSLQGGKEKKVLANNYLIIMSLQKIAFDLKF
jgi:hypothetical protein